MKSLTLITFSNLKMLSMKFNFTYLWSLAALLMCCTSCSDSDPAPTPEEDETVSLIATLENEISLCILNGAKRKAKAEE